MDQLGSLTFEGVKKKSEEVKNTVLECESELELLVHENYNTVIEATETLSEMSKAIDSVQGKIKVMRKEFNRIFEDVILKQNEEKSE